jgi:HSP20 family protein
VCHVCAQALDGKEDGAASADERLFGWLPEEFPMLFNRFFANWPMLETPEWPYPWGVTMEEKEKEVLVRVELPGFEPAELNVELMGERLTVEAEHKEKEPAKKNGAKAERAYAHVKRVIPLPPEIEVEKAVAVYRNGVLEVRVPRKPEAVGRRIEVKT